MKVFQQHIQQSFQETLSAMEVAMNPKTLEALAQIAQGMSDAITAGKKILACGNGGSACQAMHFAEELTGRYRDDRRALPAISLTDSGHLSCVANDYGFEFVFSRAIEAYAQSGDYLLLLSTSGNSKNLLNALNTAKKLNVATAALLGKEGGALQGLCDVEVIMPGKTSDCIQNLHMVAIHAIIELIERHLFPENYG